MNWWKSLFGKSLETSNRARAQVSGAIRATPDLRDGYLSLLRHASVLRPFGNQERFPGKSLQYQMFSSREELTRFFDTIRKQARTTPPPRLIEFVCGHLAGSHRVAAHYKKPFVMLTPYFGDALRDAGEWYIDAVQRANDTASVGMHADGSEAPEDILIHLVAVFDWVVLLPQSLRNDSGALSSRLADQPTAPDAISQKWSQLTS